MSDESLSDQPSADDILAFGTYFSALDGHQALAAIVGRSSDAAFAYVCTPNAVHVVNYERGEPRFRAGIDGAWLRLCDSRVVARLAATMAGVTLPLALGSDLTADLLAGAIRPTDAITIIGGTAEMESRLRQQYGWTNVVRHDPPFGFIGDPAAIAACVNFVVAHPARYVFLACGAPQSEVLGRHIAEHGGAVGTGLCIGASLLFATGLQRRAPLFMQRAGLEWLHRLIQEPKRMTTRLRKSQLPILTLALRTRLARR
ncbi:WecB/TagA/CpsF family glycosyltransferase [Acidisphaera sp. L21]|uniref:WecB/TagA/CpsF family glycosyltransferase n=1 Tax=Acidisphaera sp. L21 TaxID=1641851 RepID=UPI0020B16179|nr:WecB/TagA/CpsF family glycosyltransferase [Acidisphaera sp. L21]